jgi:hypothetical protein
MGPIFDGLLTHPLGYVIGGRVAVILSAIMTVPHSNAPKFKSYEEGEAIPSVDPDHIKRAWEYDHTHSVVGSSGWQWLRIGKPYAARGRMSQTFRAVAK